MAVMTPLLPSVTLRITSPTRAFVTKSLAASSNTVVVEPASAVPNGAVASVNFVPDQLAYR